MSTHLRSSICLPLSDIDECQYNKGGCEYKCINLHGGYRCDCPKDHRLHADGRSCIGRYTMNVNTTKGDVNTNE